MISKLETISAQSIDQQSAREVAGRHVRLDSGAFNGVSGASRSPDHHLLVSACLVHLLYPPANFVAV